MFDRNSASPVIGMPPQFSDIDIKPQLAFAPGPYPTRPPRRADSETAIYGHMPMYGMQGAQQIYRSQNDSPNVTMTSNNIQFDQLMTHDEWANTFLDPSLGLNDGQPAFGGPQQFGPQGQNMGGWR
jgi:hypothetical protein